MMESQEEHLGEFVFVVRADSTLTSVVNYYIASFLGNYVQLLEQHNSGQGGSQIVYIQGNPS